MAVLNDEIKECFTSDFFRHSKSISLVDPHEGGMYGDAFVETKGQRNLHGFDGVVATIGIAGIVGLAHTGDQMADTTPISQRAGKTEKDQVAAGHESAWQAVAGQFDLRCARERRVGDCAESIELEQMIITKPLRPSAVQSRHSFAQSRANREFNSVPLAIVETDRLHPREAFKRPGEANGGILPARKKDKRCIGFKGHGKDTVSIPLR